MGPAKAIECIAYRAGWERELARFFAALNAEGDELFFHPHAWDEATLRSLAQDINADMYFLFVQDRDVLAYGLLRGWDAGYEIPSLGVAVHPSARSSGLGRLMIQYLETMARHRGVHAVRLRVHIDNVLARDMYVRHGYHMEPDQSDDRLLVGFKAVHGCIS